MSCVTLVRDEVYRNYLTNCIVCIVCNPLAFYLKYIFSLEQKLTCLCLGWGGAVCTVVFMSNPTVVLCWGWGFDKKCLFDTEREGPSGSFLSHIIMVCISNLILQLVHLER